MRKRVAAGEDFFVPINCHSIIGVGHGSRRRISVRIPLRVATRIVVVIIMGAATLAAMLRLAMRR